MLNRQTSIFVVKLCEFKSFNEFFGADACSAGVDKEVYNL